MKKIISLFLALLMAFSVVTVAFATEGDPAVDPETTVASGDEETTAPEDEEGATDFGDFQWIMDLPFWTAKSGLKIAKVAFKLVSVYLKIAKVFGLVEEDMDDMILGAIMDLITKTENGEEVPEETTAATTTAPAVAA